MDSGCHGKGELPTEVSREHLDRFARRLQERHREQVVRDAAVAAEVEASSTGPASLGERLVDLRPEGVGVELVPRQHTEEALRLECPRTDELVL